MRRLAFIGVLALSLFVCGQVAADDPLLSQDEPPVRLKKKVKPTPMPTDKKPESIPKDSTKKPEPPRKAPAAKEEEPEVMDLEQKLKEITDRLAKNLQTAENRLKDKDSGEDTQQVQRDIVKDLDQLIEQTKRQQQQQQQSSSSSSQQQKQQRNKQRQQASKQQDQQANPTQDQQQANNARGGNRSPRENEMSKVAEMYKDIWGHLPETLRQEMNQYAREQFMPKYNELLKQYYATIAEKGRQKNSP